MLALGLSPLDRDSPEYREKVRDLEYQACLVVAAEQLKLGLNVVLPGPWNRELASGQLFDAEALGFPSETHLAHAYLDLPPDTMKRRIEERADPRDAWKIAHWEEYSMRLSRPAAVDTNKLRLLTPEMSEKAMLDLLQKLCSTSKS